jgi:adenylate cyclase, class 2
MRPKARKHEEGGALKAPMLEVEYKAPVDDLAAIAERLVALGAERIEEQTEEDAYYAHPVRRFQDTDEALRLRTVKGTTTRQVLTYKGPRRSGPTRVREEIEVDCEGAMDRVLDALSFRLAGMVRKHRTLYRLDDLTVTLDDVDDLGDFVEIEGIAQDEASVDGSRSRVLDLVARLGLGPEERRSYLEMVLQRSGKE